MMLRTLLMISLLVVAGAAAAFEPRDGTEVLLVDPDGESILGFGRIHDGGLDLQLSPATGPFTLMMVQEDGSIDVFGGRREGLERLEVLIPDVGVRTLSSLLMEAGFALRVTLLPGLGGGSGATDSPSPDDPVPVTPPVDDRPDGDDDGDDADDDGDDADDDDDDDDGDDDGDGDGDEADAGDGDDDDDGDGDADDDGDDDDGEGDDDGD